MDAMNFKKKVAYFLRCTDPKPILFSNLIFCGFFGLILPAGGPKCAAVLHDIIIIYTRIPGLQIRDKWQLLAKAHWSGAAAPIQVPVFTFFSY